MGVSTAKFYESSFEWSTDIQSEFNDGYPFRSGKGMDRATLFHSGSPLSNVVNYADLVDAIYGNGLVTSLNRHPDELSTYGNDIRKRSYEDFVRVNSKTFEEYLRSMKYEDLAEWFESVYAKNPDGAKTLIQSAFSSILEKREKEADMIKSILALMCEFSYEEMSPVGITIASAAMALKGDEIKSKVLDLLGHWGNRYAYNLLSKLERPNSFIIGMKFDALNKSFAKKYALSQEVK